VPDNPRPAGAAAARSQQRNQAQVWQEYVTRISSGDEAALAQLYDESSSWLYSLALRMLSSPADAEEVVCDVYSHIWRNAGSFDPSRGSVLSWISMLCRSRCLDRMRSRSMRRQTEIAVETTDLEALADPVWPGELQVRREAVRQAMEALEPDQRELLRLAFFSGLTHTELADQLHLPLGTIKGRIRSAILKMRHLLEGFSA
jgi:RNA polymerase sigma-70 factor (ECF subfamily)